MLIISQYGYPRTDDVNTHTQLHVRTCCNLVDTEAVISSQFSPSGLLSLFQLVSLSRQDALHISASATVAGPDVTAFFVANMRENNGPLSNTLTSNYGEVLLFP